MSESKNDFEFNLNALAEVVRKIEQNECTLEESIELFEKGMTYSANCKKALSEAEIKITKLSEALGED